MRLDGRRRETPGSLWRWARRLGLFVLIVYLALFAWTGRLIGQAEVALREERLEDAEAYLTRAAFWSVRRGRVQDALGVVALERGRLDEGRTRLARARGGLFRPAAFAEVDLLRGFLRDGQYEAARIYAEHRLAVDDRPRIAYLLGVAEAALGLLDKADGHLSAAAEDALVRDDARRALATVTERRSQGRSPYLFDRSGAPLANIDLKSGETELLVPALSGLLEGPSAPSIAPHEKSGRIELTLDLGFQRAAEAALGDQKGGLVVLDVRTGGILAIASRPGSTGGEPPLALSRSYEPGSILKMLTLSAALRADMDPSSLFPMECPGWIPIDRQPFRDWMTHGHVESIEEAVAVSCNIAFGRLGLLVGYERLDSELRRFGFVQGENASSERRTDIAFRVGRLLPTDMRHPDYALARRAEGLDSVEITIIHAAMIAAGIALGHVAPDPHLIASRTNVLGETYEEFLPPSPPESRLSPEQVSVLRRGMVAAYAHPRGTGRRARIDGMTLALKTGTSGSNPPGHDALVIGFAPAESPRVAWALIAEAAGKAELEGARITRDLVRRFADHLDAGGS